MVGEMEYLDPVIIEYRGELACIANTFTGYNEMAIHGRDNLAILEVTHPLSPLREMLRNGVDQNDLRRNFSHPYITASARLFPVLVLGRGFSPRRSRRETQRE